MDVHELHDMMVMSYTGRSTGRKKIIGVFTLRLTGCLVDPAGDVFDVLRRQSRHGDARVARHVDVAFVDDPSALLFSQS